MSVALKTAMGADNEGAVLAQFIANDVTGLKVPKSSFSTWDTEGDQIACHFSYISCTDNFVSELNIHSIGVSGILDPAISKLIYLKNLILYETNVSGQIPRTLGDLSKLEILFLNSNFFNGSIPEELGNAKSLKRMDLSNNKLTGQIPESFANLTELKSLNLSHNSLSGPLLAQNLSSSFPTGFLNLDTLDVSYNNISGSVPLELAKFCTTGAFEGNPYLDKTICTYSPPPPPPSPPVASNKGGVSMALVVGIVVGILALIMIIAIILICRRKSKTGSWRSLTAELLPHSGSSSAASHYSFLERVTRFTLAEILDATLEFSESRQLGEGGASVVYKGDLPNNGGQIAVKRLKNYYTRGSDQFIKEIDVISRTVHVNLLRLEGFCLEAGERILIFPFMANGSVAGHLKGGSRPPIPVGVKRGIARDVAEGLSYMHWDCSPQLLHRDIKADNILLTNGWDAKVADFGLAKSVGDDEEGQQTALRGTIGHIAPEYHMSGNVSDRTDVFAFGVFLVELVLGRPMSELAEAVPDSYSLQEWVVALLQQDSLREAMHGPAVPADDFAGMEELLQLAALCMQEQPEDRLSTKECCVILRGEGLGDRWSQWQNPDSGAISLSDDDPLASSRGPNWTGTNSALFTEGGQSTDWQHSQAYPIDLSGPR